MTQLLRASIPRGLGALSLCLEILIPGAAAAEPAALHVDPATGVDRAGGGASDSPFRTLTFALGQAVGATDVEIRLAPGVYRASRDAGSDEEFPLRIPPGVERLVIVGGKPASQLVAEDPASPVLDLEVRGGGRNAHVELSLLEILGGLSGACFSAGAGGTITGRIEGCVFSGQSGKGIESFIAGGATAEIDVIDSLVEGTSGGVAVETAVSCHARLHVEGCTFRSIAAYGPRGLLGAGVEAHVDPGAHVRVEVLRSVFWSLASAVQLTASEEGEESAPGGTLVAVVAGNLIGGLTEPGAFAARNGIYLSLWPHHDVALDITSNTFVGIGEHVLHHDNLDALRDRGSIPWTFANNIAWGIGGSSEFDEESPGLPFPPKDVVVRTNILEKSLLGLDGANGNFSSSPGFADEAAGDYRLAADSPARDRGEAGFAGHTTADIDGRCRVAAPSCPPAGGVYSVDIGAYEFPGYCENDAFVFRRGDCNASDGSVEITDAIFTFGVLFLGAGSPRCEDACDSNDDGQLNIADGISTLIYLFVAGEPLPPPAGDGTDPSRDCLEPCN